MSRCNDVLRKCVNYMNRKRLRNKDFSLLSSNCNGSFLLHDLGMRFNTPTINLWIGPDDFIRFLRDLEYYLNCNMTFIKEPGIDYPIGVLDDVKIYFQHYSSEAQALNDWQRRSQRIRFDNLYIMFTDRDGCTYQNLVEFDSLPYENKVVFTHLPHPELKSAFYIAGWEDQPSVGLCFTFKNRFTGKKYYDAFDYVAWFNQSSKH